ETLLEFRRVLYLSGKTDDIRPNRNRFCSIESRFHSSTCNNGSVFQFITNGNDAIFCRNAPIVKGLSCRLSQRFIGTQLFYLTPRCSTCSSYIDVRNTRIVQLFSNRPINSESNLFHAYGHVQPLTYFFNCWEEAFKVQISFILKYFLQAIQVENERICFGHVNNSLRLFDSISVIQLHRPYIANQWNSRSLFTEDRKSVV